MESSLEHDTDVHDLEEVMFDGLNRLDALHEEAKKHADPVGYYLAGYSDLCRGTIGAFDN